MISAVSLGDRTTATLIRRKLVSHVRSNKTCGKLYGSRTRDYLGKLASQTAMLVDASTGRFDAQRVLTDHNTHRVLWKSFFMRRAIMPTFNGELPSGDLIPLRDLHRCWNLDTLYILVQDEAALAPLSQVAEEWGCEVGHYDLQQSEQLLGSTRCSPPIIWCWWD